jgi:hypothetical protein
MKLTPQSSAINSIKEIVVLLAGLTFTVGISRLLLDSDGRTIRDLSAITISEKLQFILLILGLLRFYHGNYQFLDLVYIIKKDAIRDRHNYISLDYLAVFTTALLFTAMSFFLGDFTKFSATYYLILLIDVSWLLVTRRKKLFDYSNGIFQIDLSGQKWMLNNLGHLLALTAIGAIYAIDHSNLDFPTYSLSFWAIIALLYSNTLFDFAFNFLIYFPADDT